MRIRTYAHDVPVSPSPIKSPWKSHRHLSCEYIRSVPHIIYKHSPKARRHLYLDANITSFLRVRVCNNNLAPIMSPRIPHKVAAMTLNRVLHKSPSPQRLGSGFESTETIWCCFPIFVLSIRHIAVYMIPVIPYPMWRRPTGPVRVITHTIYSYAYWHAAAFQLFSKTKDRFYMTII